MAKLSPYTAVLPDLFWVPALKKTRLIEEQELTDPEFVTSHYTNAFASLCYDSFGNACSLHCTGPLNNDIQ